MTAGVLCSYEGGRRRIDPRAADLDTTASRARAGKFVTSWARMQLAYLIPGALTLALGFALLDDPQAPIAIPHVTAASAISALQPFRLTITSVVVHDT